MKRRACFVAALCAAALTLTACSGPDLSSLSSDFPGGESEASSTGEATAEEPAAEEDVGYPVDGYAEGRIGDTMHTYFFDYTVNDAYTCASYEGTTPASGNIFLVVDITVKNTSTQSYNMFDTDFQAQWGTEGEEDYRVPITTDPETYEELAPPVGRTAARHLSPGGGRGSPGPAGVRSARRLPGFLHLLHGIL